MRWGLWRNFTEIGNWTMQTELNNQTYPKTTVEDKICILKTIFIALSKIMGKRRIFMTSTTLENCMKSNKSNEKYFLKCNDIICFPFLLMKCVQLFLYKVHNDEGILRHLTMDTLCCDCISKGTSIKLIYWYRAQAKIDWHHLVYNTPESIY